MRREWSPEELIACWTLVDEDWRLVGNKSGATRLGFALLLKFFEIEARLPRAADELPPSAVAYVAEQVRVEATGLAEYRWTGRTIEYHRAQIRAAFGFREFARGDEDKLAEWLAEEVCPVELRDEQLRGALLVRCRSERIEPPGRVERIIGSARAAFEQRFCERTSVRLSATCALRLEALVDEEAGRNLLAELKSDPGQVGLETLLREIDKLAGSGRSACRWACSRTRRRSWWRRGAPGRPAPTRQTCRPRRRRCGRRCWRRCAGCAPRRSPTRWWIC